MILSGIIQAGKAIVRTWDAVVGPSRRIRSSCAGRTDAIVKLIIGLTGDALSSIAAGASWGAAEAGGAISAWRVLSIRAWEAGVVDEGVVGVTADADAGVVVAEGTGWQGGIAEIGLREGDAYNQGNDQILHLFIIYLLLI